MLYIGYLIILDGRSIKKNQFRKISIFELLRRENCISRSCALDSLVPPHTQIR